MIITMLNTNEYPISLLKDIIVFKIFDFLKKVIKFVDKYSFRRI